ncbi:hypothetical protein GCM10025777_58730 [Membranihabitans marinus]
MDQVIIIPEEEVSIFDLVEDIQFLRLGHPSQEESLFSAIKHAFFLDSFIVCGQNGIDYGDHGQYEYFDYQGNFIRRFSAHNVLKEGIFYTTLFHADNNGLYITDRVRNQTYHLNHHGHLVEQFPPINKASLYIPLNEDIVLYTYCNKKPKGLIDDDEFYDFFLYSKRQQKVIQKAVTEIPEYERIFFSGGQFLYTGNNTIYHSTAYDFQYIVYSMNTSQIEEVDRLKFSQGMIQVDQLTFNKAGMPIKSYYSDNDIIIDVFALQKVKNMVYGLIMRGWKTNYVFKKNLRNGSSQAIRINWHGLVKDNYIDRGKIIHYSKDGYIATHSPAFNFKPFLDANKEILEPHLINDFSDFSYNDNDVIILIKFKPEYYQM